MKLKFNLNAAIKKNNSKTSEKVVEENLDNVCATEPLLESEQCILNQFSETAKNDNLNKNAVIGNLNECLLDIKLSQSETFEAVHDVINDFQNNSLSDELVKEIKISSSQFEPLRSDNALNIKTIIPTSVINCDIKPENLSQSNTIKDIPAKIKFNFKNAINKNTHSKEVTKKSICNSTETNETNATINKSNERNIHEIPAIIDTGIVAITIEELHGNPSEQDGNPSDQDRNPLEQDRNPSEQDRNPSEQDGNPSEQDGNPSDQDRNPLEQDRNPSEQDGNPSEQDGNPSDQDGNPSDQDRNHSEQDRNSSEQDGNPSDQDRNPSDQDRNPSEQDRNPSEHKDNNRTSGNVTKQNQSIASCEPLVKSDLPAVVPFQNARKSLIFNEIVQLMQEKGQEKSLLNSINNTSSRSNKLIRKVIVRKSCANTIGITPAGAPQVHFNLANSKVETNDNERKISERKFSPVSMETLETAESLWQPNEQGILQSTCDEEASKTDNKTEGVAGTTLGCSLEPGSDIEGNILAEGDFTGIEKDIKQKITKKSRKAGHVKKRRESAVDKPYGATGSSRPSERDSKPRKSARLSKLSINISDNHSEKPDSDNITIDSLQNLQIPDVPIESLDSPGATHKSLQREKSPKITVESSDSLKVTPDAPRTPECHKPTEKSIIPLSPPVATATMKFNLKNAVNKSAVAVAPPKPTTEIQIHLSDICTSSKSNAIVPFVTNSNLPLFKSPEKASKIIRRMACPSAVQSETDDNLSTRSSSISEASSANRLHGNSESSNGNRKRKEKSFVLKRHSELRAEDERDLSKLTLLELINIEPRLPPPQSRLNKSNKRAGDSSDQNLELERISSSSQQKSANKSKSKKFRIDLDGQIVIDDEEDETNMQISTEGMEEIVENAADLRSSYRSYMKRRLSGKRWKAEETRNFYKALLAVKTDFTRMATIFKGRSRADLKKKFKVEEKLNSKLVYEILVSPVVCDISNLVIDSHLNPPTKHKKPRKDAVKRNLRGSTQSDSDVESVKPKPKRRYRKFDIKQAKLDPTATDLPDYLKAYEKIMK